MFCEIWLRAKHIIVKIDRKYGSEYLCFIRKTAAYVRLWTTAVHCFIDLLLNALVHR